VADLLINEIFGPTLQGEGPYAGQLCVFVRVANCNLTCKWCDTSYTWAFTPNKAKLHRTGKQYDKAEEVHSMSVDEIVRKVVSLNGPCIVVISGGEPLIQAIWLAELCRLLDQRDYSTHIETAGTRFPGPLEQWVEAFIVSPKLANSGNPFDKRYRPAVLARFATALNERSWFKFVVSEPTDLNEVDKIVEDCYIRRDRVMIMPEGLTANEIVPRAQRIANDVLKRGYGLTMREHVLIWGEQRAH
jgi:7-carboxy-7-deazaguanine synthase